MTVHAIEIYVSDDPPYDSLLDAIGNWVEAHNETLAEQRIEVSLANTAEDDTGTDYYQGLYRFETTDDRAELMSSVESRLNAYNWFILRWHSCDHDEDDRGGCSWDEAQYNPDQATIPDDVLALL